MLRILLPVFMSQVYSTFKGTCYTSIVLSLKKDRERRNAVISKWLELLFCSNLKLHFSHKRTIWFSFNIHLRSTYNRSKTAHFSVRMLYLEYLSIYLPTSVHLTKWRNSRYMETERNLWPFCPCEDIAFSYALQSFLFTLSITISWMSWFCHS